MLEPASIAIIEQEQTSTVTKGRAQYGTGSER